MRSEFNGTAIPWGVRVVENPISGKILVIQEHGQIVESVKVASRLLKNPLFKDRSIELSCDYGHSVFEVKPEDRTPDMTGVDLWVGLLSKRGEVPKGSDALEIIKEENGKLLVGFKDKSYREFLEDMDDVYTAAIDAVLLSREQGGKPVEFGFWNRKVLVDGKTHPEAIENIFSAAEKIKNKKNVSSTPKFRGYKPY